MNNPFQKKLNQIRILLGMNPEIALAEAILEDGVTKITAEKFEPGYEVSVVSESGETAPAPPGTHKLEDGTEVLLDENSKIVSITKPEEKVEVEIEAAEETDVEKIEEDKKTDVEKIKEEVAALYQALALITEELTAVKEELSGFKVQKEKMSKTPAAKKLSTLNTESVQTPSGENHLELKLEHLKKVRAEYKNIKTKK